MLREVVEGGEEEEDAEILLEEDLEWKEEEEVDQEKKGQHLEIDTYQHLGKDKI